MIISLNILNKFSSQLSLKEKYLEEHISLIKKNLCTKDEKVKTLVDTQSTVHNAILAKPNNQHSNTINQSSSSLTSKSCRKFSQPKGISFTRIQHLPNARLCSSQLQETSHPIQTHHQRPEQNIPTKNLYVGNLSEDITKQDIYELFGSNSTSYLRDASNLDFPIDNKTGKFKDFVRVHKGSSTYYR